MLVCFGDLEKNAKLPNFLFDNFAGPVDQDGIYVMISADKIYAKNGLYCITCSVLTCYLPFSETDGS